METTSQLRATAALHILLPGVLMSMIKVCFEC